MGPAFLLLFFLEAFEGLFDHLIIEPFFPEEDLFLHVGHLLNILALQEDGRNRNKLLLFLHLLQLFLLLLLPLGLGVAHYDVIIKCKTIIHFLPLAFTFVFPSAFGAFFDLGSFVFSLSCDAGMKRKYPRAATIITRRGRRIFGLTGSF